MQKTKKKPKFMKEIMISKRLKLLSFRVQIEKDIEVVLNNKNQDFNLIKMMIIIFFYFNCK